MVSKRSVLGIFTVCSSYFFQCFMAITHICLNIICALINRNPTIFVSEVLVVQFFSKFEGKTAKHLRDYSLTIELLFLHALQYVVQHTSKQENTKLEGKLCKRSQFKTLQLRTMPFFSFCLYRLGFDSL